MTVDPRDERNKVTRMDHHPRPVDDYTSAFLWSFGALLFCVFFAIWAVWGLIGAGVAGYAADKGVSRMARARS